MTDEAKTEAPKLTPPKADAPKAMKKGKDDAPGKAEGPAKPPGPRVCHETERAIHGLRRFRVRAVECRSVGLYILAPDEESAEACYLEAEAAELLAAGYDKDKKPVLRIDPLPD